MRGADETVMEQLLRVKKGSVNLFSLLNDTQNQVKLVIDSRLWNDAERIGFHPMQNDATTSIGREDMKKFVQITKHEPIVVDFEKIDAEE